MKEYLKPYIEDEEIELEDVIAQSINNAGEGDAENDGQEGNFGGLFPNQP